MSLLNGLEDRFTRNRFERGYLEGRLGRLVDLLPQETDLVVRAQMFRVLERALSVHGALVDVSLDALVPYLDESDPAFIAGALLLIAKNGDRKYLPLVARYRGHANAIVSANAEYAWKYMEGDGRSDGGVSGG